MFYPTAFLAVAMFLPLFVFQKLGPLDFWWWMSTNLIVLITLGIATDKLFRLEIKSDVQQGLLKKIGLGLLSAAVLYLVFFVGNYLIRLILEFAGRDISNVYAFKGDASSLRIGILMLLIIGPGEELFWRAYMQGNFSRRFGKINGFLLATAFYSLIHVATGNLVLILAALVGGIFWGWMYMKFRSVTMNILSHIIWDIAVFLVFPFH